MNQQKLIQELKKGTIETSEKGTKRILPKRWRIAQNSEKEYWDDYTTSSLLEESGDRYPKKADVLLKEWSKFIEITDNTKILQIGAGPEDVINYFNTGILYSIDPLANFYKKKFDLNYKKTKFIQARGEELHFPDKFFDVVILINVLDHTETPDKVISEIHRVLKDKGIFHFENYIYQKRFIQIGRFYGKIRGIFTREMFNIHHPFMFTLNDVKRILSKKFNILYEEVGRDIGLYENLEDLKKQTEKQNKKLRRRILAKLGLLGIINYMTICRKIKVSHNS